MKIAALVFDKITVLDIVGPAEVLGWVPGSEIVWAGKDTAPMRAAPGWRRRFRSSRTTRRRASSNSGRRREQAR